MTPAWKPIPAPFLGEREHRLHVSNFKYEGNPYYYYPDGRKIRMCPVHEGAPLSFPASILIGPRDPMELPF